MGRIGLETPELKFIIIAAFLHCPHKNTYFKISFLLIIYLFVCAWS